MGDNVRPDPLGRLRRTGDIDIPIPNPALAKWLLSPECEVAVRNAAQQVYDAYYQALPMSKRDPKVKGSGQQRLKKGAGIYVEIQNDRWQSWVINKAMSYRPTKNKPYPRYIEYGKENRDGSRSNAGHQLRDAAMRVFGNKMTAADGISSAGGYSPGSGRSELLEPRARPARKPAAPAAPPKILNVMQQKAARRAALEEAARNRFKKPPQPPKPK
jgi:hypothetical protein